MKKKISKTYSIDDYLFETFDRMTSEKFLNKSQWIENKIQEYVDYNKYKDTFGANDTLSKISDRINEFIEEDKIIQGLIKNVEKRSNLITTLKMDTNFHKIEITFEPKFPFDPNLEYISSVDDEIVSIIDSSLNYVILSNGNKLRIKDFEKLYSLVINPDKFFNGELKLQDCMSSTLNSPIVDADRVLKSKRNINEEFNKKMNLINLISEVNKQINNVTTIDEIIGILDKPHDEQNLESVDEVDCDIFFKNGEEEFFGLAAQIIKFDVDKIIDNSPTTIITENISPYLECANISEYTSKSECFPTYISEDERNNILDELFKEPEENDLTYLKE